MRTLYDCVLQCKESSVQMTGVRCMLMRVMSMVWNLGAPHTKNLMDDSALIAFFQKDFAAHPRCYDARSICQLLWTSSVTSAIGMRDSPPAIFPSSFVVSLVKRFSAECSSKNRVSPMDLVYVVRALTIFLTSRSARYLPITSATSRLWRRWRFPWAFHRGVFTMKRP